MPRPLFELLWDQLAASDRQRILACCRARPEVWLWFQENLVQKYQAVRQGRAAVQAVIATEANDLRLALAALEQSIATTSLEEIRKSIAD